MLLRIQKFLAATIQPSVPLRESRVAKLATLTGRIGLLSVHIFVTHVIVVENGGLVLAVFPVLW